MSVFQSADGGNALTETIVAFRLRANSAWKANRASLFVSPGSRSTLQSFLKTKGVCLIVPAALGACAGNGNLSTRPRYDRNLQALLPPQ
jgi:hypothetical protein